jgi:hypothetical protein
MRKFPTGATRDDDKEKLDYEGFLSPIVQETFAEYMHVHRRQSDGNLRDSDNWQSGFGSDHYSICMKSLFRHFMDLWCLHRGYKRFDKKDGHSITKEEAACAVLFNVQAYLHKLVEQKYEKET